MPQDETSRQEILDLLAAGKITAIEAAELLTAVKKKVGIATDEINEIEKSNGFSDDPELILDDFPDPIQSKTPTWFHVKVSDISSGKSKVTVNIPLRLVKYGLSVGRRFVPEMAEFDLDTIAGELASQTGLLVDVFDDKDGDHVQIYVD